MAMLTTKRVIQAVLCIVAFDVVFVALAILFDLGDRTIDSPHGYWILGMFIVFAVVNMPLVALPLWVLMLLDSDGTSEKGTTMTIEERIGRVEKKYRFVLSLLFIFCTLVLLDLVVRYRVPAEAPDVIRAKNFEVLNDEGRLAARLGANLHGGGIAIFNVKGMPLVNIGLTAGGYGAVTTFNGEGRELVQLGAMEGGYGAVTTFSSEGKELVTLAATVDGDSSISAYNAEGKRIARLGAREGGDGSISTFNSEGKELVALVLEDGRGVVMVYDPTGSAQPGALATQPE